LFKEPIEKGKVVRHLCNNRRCCNPDHLDIGTHQDNMDDKALSIMNARDQYEQDMNYLTDLLKIKTKTKFNRFLVRFVVENADEDRLIAEYFRYTA